jgi:hypothetical protein
MHKLQAKNRHFPALLPKLSLPVLEISAAMFSNRNTPLSIWSAFKERAKTALPPSPRAL